MVRYKEPGVQVQEGRAPKRKKEKPLSPAERAQEWANNRRSKRG